MVTKRPVAYDRSGKRKAQKPHPVDGKKRPPSGSEQPYRIEVQELGETVTRWDLCNHARLLRNEVSWKHLSNQEIEMGMGLGLKGNFVGVFQKFGKLPDHHHQALIQESIRRAQYRVVEMAFKGLGIVEAIMSDPDVSAKDRLKAVDMAWNRAWGSPTQLVVTTDTKFDSILEYVAGLTDDDRIDPDLDRVNVALTMGKPDEVWDVESWVPEEPENGA
jgi:hypothetical protein